eukprot:scaffold32206_cov43-Cyclotella_meneghiniana.AAC.4
MSYRYADQLLLAALQARTTPVLWKSVMLELSDFKFMCVNTGNIYVSGLMVLDALFTRLVATTRLKLKEWTKKFNAVSMKFLNNNFPKMVSELLYLQSMIQEVKGKEFCSDIELMDRLFEILNVYEGCDVWRHNVIQEQGNDAKVISLITNIDKIDASLKAAHVALTAKQSEFNNRKPAAKVTPGKKDDLWKMTKDGEVKKCPNTGVSFKWCGKGHGKGYYMPMDHNHEEWLIKKQAYKEKDAARRRDSNGDSGPLKKRTVRLDDNIKSALTTRATEENGFSAPEARHYLRDICFDEQSKEILSDPQGRSILAILGNSTNSTGITVPEGKVSNRRPEQPKIKFYNQSKLILTSPQSQGAHAHVDEDGRQTVCDHVLRDMYYLQIHSSNPLKLKVPYEYLAKNQVQPPEGCIYDVIAFVALTLTFLWPIIKSYTRLIRILAMRRAVKYYPGLLKSTQDDSKQVTKRKSKKVALAT